MIALLSGAWWAQKLGGVVTQATALALIVTLIVGGLVGGLWWLRYDARRDASAGWAVRLANARVQDTTRLLSRQRQSERIGNEKAANWAAQLAAAEKARANLEAKLASMKTNPVCWPKGIVGDLNR